MPLQWRKELRGTDAITAYWRQRLAETPAGDLIDLQWDGSDVVLDFRVPGGIVQATLRPRGYLNVATIRSTATALITGILSGSSRSIA